MRRDRISSAYNPKVTTTALLPMTGRVERSIGQQGDPLMITADQRETAPDSESEAPPPQLPGSELAPNVSRLRI